MWKNLFFLATGMVFGVCIGIFSTKTYYENLTQEEINSVKTHYSERKKTSSNAETPHDIAKRNAEEKAKLLDLSAASDISNRQNYGHFFNKPEAEVEEEVTEEYSDDYSDIVDATPPKEGLAEGPYTISPLQFVNEEPFFDKITLEYFEDDVLCSEDEEIITDIQAVIGRESLTKFGEYEEDVVYVRNERRSTDYEIIHQHRPFAVSPEDFE